MNAAELLSSMGRNIPLHPVAVRLVDPADPARVGEVPAVLRFVPDRARLAALDSAAESIAKLNHPTAERRVAEEAYHLLVQAVRQSDAPARVFFESVEQAKSMLVDAEAIRLRAEYERYQETHFPPFFSDEEARKLAEEARNFTLPDLLRSRGYWPILRALPFLAVTFGASLTPTFSPTESAST